ncbi:MAG: small basic protein [Candidatus Omnitrophota bacterium]
MSLHPSLATSANDKKTRSVLKRAERLKMLIDKGEWKEGQSIFALPKIKTVRMIKIKKEKAAPSAAAAGAEDAAKATPAAAKESTKPKA